MKRTLNYTGRKSLFHEDAQITLKTPTGAPASFDATLVLDEYKLPADAHVFIEAYRQTTWMRFPWGTAGEPTPHSDRSLRDFESSEDILFRVKVVDASAHGQLLAEADQISPRDPSDGDTNRTPLLPVKPEDLGDVPWQIDFRDNRTRLLINSAFGDVHAVALSGEFRALVYPAAFRSILERALCARDSSGDLPSEGEPDEWQMRWVRFSMQLPGATGDPGPFEMNDLDDRMDWIEQVVNCFCRQQQTRDAFLAVLNVGATS